MKKISFVLLSFLVLFSIFSVFSKPNPNFNSRIKARELQQQSIEIEAVATPEKVKQRLAELQSESVIDLNYDSKVQADIDLYLKNGRRQFADLLNRSEYYMPIFENALREYGLPDELKFIPIIESHLKTNVTSPRGAGGLWQFMPVAAKSFDMKITAAIDERNDPYLSSERACRLFKYLYDKFGDWSLVLAAYNAGEGTVMRAIRRAGGDKNKQTFESIKNFLPSQTRRYIPKFVAISYLMNYHEHHDIKSTSASIQSTDTVHIRSKANLSKIAGTIGISVNDLRSLNPHFRSNVIPATSSRPCNLILPTEKIKEFKESFSL